MENYNQTIKNIKQQLANFEKPQRRALSLRFPKYQKYFVLVHRGVRKLRNLSDLSIARKKKSDFFQSVVTRHQSLLTRKLGDSDPRLQRQKIKNLQIARERLNGLIIKPGQTFSFWETVGKPSKKRGFVKGMLLSNGKVVEGQGGGLCQMANLLFWLFLHSDIQVIERYHHSKDVFPDSGRVLPFGSGATLMYNYTDLKIKNISNQPIQLKIWLTEKHLKGQIVSMKSFPVKFHVVEKNHCFVNHNNQYYRYNQIYRQILIEGKVIKDELMSNNFAPVLYEVNQEYINKHGFEVIEINETVAINSKNKLSSDFVCQFLPDFKKFT